jgi:tRNA U38,U39,U40 pseudouridine synthase TruA
MVDIGLGRRPLEDMAVLLRREDNADTSPPAPPQGLYFASVVYPPELFAELAGEPHAALHPA